MSCFYFETLSMTGQASFRALIGAAPLKYALEHRYRVRRIRFAPS